MPLQIVTCGANEGDVPTLLVPRFVKVRAKHDIVADRVVQHPRLLSCVGDPSCPWQIHPRPAAGRDKVQLAEKSEEEGSLSGAGRSDDEVDATWRKDHVLVESEGEARRRVGGPCEVRVSQADMVAVGSERDIGGSGVLPVCVYIE
jgi:hypothetical protein